MKKDLFILFNLVVVILLSTLLTSQNILAESNVTSIEIEEEKFDINRFDAEDFNNTEFVNDNSSKKTSKKIEVTFVENFSIVKENSKIIVNFQSSTLTKKIICHIPNYILYCSLIVYS